MIVVPVVLVFDNFLLAKAKETLDPAEEAKTSGDLLKILITQLLQFVDGVAVGGGHDDVLCVRWCPCVERDHSISAP